MSPRYALSVTGTVNYVGIATYFMTALTIVAFGQAFRSARERAEALTEEFRREAIERVKVEAALRESESRFRFVADTAPVKIWMSDTTKHCTWVNKKWLELTGRPMDQELGNGWSERMHPDDFERCQSIYGDSFDARVPFSMEYRLRRHDGEYRWLLDHGVPRFKAEGDFVGYIGSCVDITDRKLGEAQLIESEKRFRMLADNISQFAWMVDARGETCWFNQRWYDYTGTTLDTMQGWGWKTVHHPDYVDRVVEKWRRAHATGEPWEDTFPLRGRDGAYRWFLSRALPIRDDTGRIVRWFGTNTDITELRETNAALRKSEERYRTLYESIDEGFCVIEVLFDERKQAVDYVFLEINSSFERQTGIQNARGRSMREIAPEHEAHWFDLYGTIALTGESKRFEYPAIELERWYEGYAYRVGDGQERKVGILFNDITERKQAEEKLRASERLMRAVFNQQFAFSALLSSTGEILQFSESVYRNNEGTNIRPHDLIGTSFLDAPWWDGLPDTVAEWRRQFSEALSRPDPARGESPYRLANGEQRYAMNTVTALRDDGGNVEYLLCEGMDVTDLKRSQLHLKHSAEELERQVSVRTAELLATQDRLRSLATELNLAEQRERKRLAGELHDYLAQWLVLCRLNLAQVRRAGLAPDVEEKIRQTEDVLNQALNYSRTLITELSPRVLHDQGLAAGLKWLGEGMQRHGLTVRVDTDSGSDMMIPEDCRVLLFQSVRELLMNALKHAQCKTVVIRPYQDGGNLCIEVQDDGVGFDPGTDDPAIRPSKFGLFSIQERMLALGGRFELQSRPGLGTTATLRLPTTECAEKQVRVKQSGEVPRFRADAAIPNQKATKQIRVLLVDDHPMMRQGLRSLLEPYPNVDVVGEASDGQEAIELADQLRPTLIVMDVNMPKMNGIEATAVIKARSPDTSVIGLSVHAGHDTEQAMRTVGAAMLLPKESAAEELYRAIQMVVEGGTKTGGNVGDRMEA